MLPDQYLSQVGTSNLKTIVPITETEYFCEENINHINFKNLILKIITFGCLNNYFNKKNEIKIEPWVKKLTKLRKENWKNNLVTNKLLAEAEKKIQDNEVKNFEFTLQSSLINVTNEVISKDFKKNNEHYQLQTEINEELFFDAKDDQPWLENQIFFSCTN